MLTPMKRLLFAIVLLSAARTAAARGMFSETFAVPKPPPCRLFLQRQPKPPCPLFPQRLPKLLRLLFPRCQPKPPHPLFSQRQPKLSCPLFPQCLPKPRRVFVRFSRKPPYPLFLRPQVISSGPAFRLLLHLPHPPRRLPPLSLLPTDGPLRFSKNWLRDSVRWALTE